MRAGLEAGTKRHPPLLPFAVCSLLQCVLAQTIKILAHDNKPGAGCLLNLGLPLPAGRLSAVRFVLRHLLRFKLLYGGVACRAEGLV
jgi:hypothetical protein